MKASTTNTYETTTYDEIDNFNPTLEDIQRFTHERICEEYRQFRIGRNMVGFVDVKLEDFIGY